MSASNPFVVGDLVDVAITRAGGSNEPVVGRLRGTVEHAGIEVDVRLLLDDDGDDGRAYGQAAEDVEDVLAAAGGDVRLEDLLEGPIYLLRNCQPEDCSIVPAALSREVYERIREKWDADATGEALRLAAILSDVEARLGAAR